MVYSQVFVGVRPWRILVKTGRSGKEQVDTGEQRNYGGYERVKMWILRHERSWLRERESALQGWDGVELMTVVEWCVSGAKDLRFIDREVYKRGEELRNDRSANLSPMETGGRERHRWSEERLLLGGLIFMSLWRYFGSVIWRRLCVMEMILYWIRCSTLSQWRDLNTEEMWECWWVRVTARASPCWICWRRLIWLMGRPW